MQNQTIPLAMRRSSRVPVAIPIMVTSLEPKTHFSEVCETMVVSAHGCAMRSRMKLDTGTSLHFHSKEGRDTTARVISCQPMGAEGQSWKLGARLDQPENFWGLQSYPDDWVALVAASSPSSGQFALPQVSEESVRRLIEEWVRPLHTEVVALREKLARRESNRSSFEVSLSSIPPELEQQLELRLRKELGPRVLDEARQQSAQLLAAANGVIEQKTGEAYQDFLRQVANELKVVEQRAREISAHISENVRENLNVGLGEFQQRLMDGGSRLKRLSEELLEFLQQNLNEEHKARREELEEIRAAVASESSRLREDVEQLDDRVAKLDESARGLESGLDKRLSQMSSDTVRSTRGELESAADAIVKDVAARNTKALESKLDEACGNMKIVQRGVVASVSESLKAQANDSLKAFEQSMEELTKRSVERCRIRLAAGLNAVVKNLGDQFQIEAESADETRR